MTEKAPNHITAPNDILMSEIRELLGKGCEVTLRAKGRSMAPYIKDGKDNLIIVPVSPASLKVGDAVLAYTTDGRYVLHRIVGIDGQTVTLKGDGNPYGTEQCRAEDVLGYLAAIERKGRRIDCNTPAERRKAAWMSAVWTTWLKIRGRLGAIKRRIFR